MFVGNLQLLFSDDDYLFQPQLPIQSAEKQINADKCPNTAILLHILNILTNSLPQNGKTALEPEKFKYVLTVVKNFVEAMSFNPENYEMYNNFKNIEAQFDKINIPVQKQSFKSINDPKIGAKKPLHYNLAAQQYSRCQEIFISLMKFINTAYSQVLRYCLTTENCGIKTENSFPYIHSDLNKNPYIDNNAIHFTPLTPIQRNSMFNFLLPSETNSNDSKTAGADLLNFIKHQKQNGVNNIMSILQNYRPNEVNNIAGNEMKSPKVQNPQLYLNSGNNQAPNILTPVNQYNGKDPSLQPSNIYKPPNSNNAVSWQTIFSRVKELPENTYENQQHDKYLTQKLYNGNHALYPSVETSSYFVNGQIVPILTGAPNVNPKETAYLNIYNVPGLIMNPNEKQNLFNTNMKIPKFEQNLNNLQDLPQQTSYFQNQFLNNYPQPLQGISNQNLPISNPIFQTSQFLNTKYSNGQNNILTDNTKQGNYGGELLDLNRILGVTNLDKLNTIPHSNGVVELTYLFKRPQPVNEQQYYVKYRMPYQTFLYNLQKLLINKPNLRNEPNLLYQELLVGSNVTDASNDLKGLNYNDLMTLTSTNGTLITAKMLEGNDSSIIDKPLKVVQKLNSKLPVENLINFNMNATRNIQQKLNGNMNSSATNDLLKNIYPRFVDTQRRGIYPNSVYPIKTIGQNLQNQPNLQINPYPVYQPKPIGQVGMPLIKYGAAIPNVIVKYPTLYFPYVGTNYYPQFGRKAYF